MAGLLEAPMPIMSGARHLAEIVDRGFGAGRSVSRHAPPVRDLRSEECPRSEERRVGKECRSRGWPDHEKKKKKGDAQRRVKVHPGHGENSQKRGDDDR